MKSKRVLALLLAVVMMVGLLSGCSSSDNNNSNLTDVAEVGSSRQGETDPHRVDDTLTYSQLTEGQKTVVDKVVIGVQSDPSDWAPTAAPQNGRTVAVNGMSLYQPLGYFIGSTFCNQLCESYEISEDGRTVTAKMFDYIKDHNGNKVDANDAVYSYYWELESGFLRGTKKIEKVEAIDDYTVQFTLNADMDIDTLGTCLGFNIFSQKSMEESENGMSNWPVGTGHYKLTAYESGSKFVYERNEDYWQTNEDYIYAHDFANVKTLEYLIIPESAQRSIALEMGTIDFCQEISADDIGKYMEGGAQSDKYWTYGAYDNLCMYLYPNMTEGKVTADENFAKALFYATNSQAVVDSVFKGLAVTCWDFGSRWVQGYDPAWENEDGYYQYDIDKAKEYLAKSNYNGEDLTILTEGTNDTSNTATLILGFLNQIGVTAHIEAVESSILNTYRENPDNWDILVMKFACSQYTVKGYYMSMDQGRYTWGGSINFVFDDTLQGYINQNMQRTWTQEGVQEMHEYMMEKAYGYNICNFVTNYVLPDMATKVCLTTSWSIIPGACFYGE